MDTDQIEQGIREHMDSRTPEQIENARLMYQGAIDGMLFAQYLCGLLAVFGICDPPEGMGL
jgi:hypothetical protein